MSTMTTLCAKAVGQLGIKAGKGSYVFSEPGPTETKSGPKVQQSPGGISLSK